MQAEHEQALAEKDKQLREKDALIKSGNSSAAPPSVQVTVSRDDSAAEVRHLKGLLASAQRKLALLPDEQVGAKDGTVEHFSALFERKVVSSSTEFDGFGDYVEESPSKPQWQVDLDNQKAAQEQAQRRRGDGGGGNAETFDGFGDFAGDSDDATHANASAKQAKPKQKKSARKAAMPPQPTVPANLQASFLKGTRGARPNQQQGIPL